MNKPKVPQPVAVHHGYKIFKLSDTRYFCRFQSEDIFKRSLKEVKNFITKALIASGEI